MASKVMFVALLVAAAKSSALHGGDYTSFSYGVSDPHTADVKSQHESRVGDRVVGQYSLLDSDGRKRTVDQAADAHSGVSAVIREDPPLHPYATPVITPSIPVAPIAYSAVVHEYAPAPIARSVGSYGAVALPLAQGAVAFGPHTFPLAHSAGLYGGHASPLAQNAEVYSAGPLAHAAMSYGLNGAHGYYGAHLY